MRPSLLWSIELGGTTSYLFGTMHSSHLSIRPFVDLVQPFVNECSIYAAEMDLSQYDPEAFQQAITLRDSDLNSLLGITKFTKCRQALQRHFDFELSRYRHAHPFMAISALTQRLLAADQNISLDQQLFNQASTQGLECTGLESFAQQLSFFERISVVSQARMLYKIARNPAKLRRQLQKMLADYLRQDAAALYRGTKGQLGKLRRVMLYERNAMMSQQLLRLAGEGRSVFAAVGAAHLLGGKGMVRHLKNAGAAVKPIPLRLRSHGKTNTQQDQ